MLVTNKFVFIHMHKTGGQSINTVITQCMPDHKFIGYHFPRQLLPAQYSHLPIIGVIRNPWDWYVSWFAFNNRNEINNPLFYVLSDGGVADFKKTITNLVNLGSDTKASQQYRRALIGVLPNTLKGNEGVGLTKDDIRHFSSNETGYYSWLFTRMHGLVEADKKMICRFENLQQEFSDIMNKLSIKEADAMEVGLEKSPRLNSSKHNHYSQYYDDDLRDLIALKEKSLIENYHYQFEDQKESNTAISFPNAKVDAHDGAFRKLLGQQSNFLSLGEKIDVSQIRKILEDVPESTWLLSGREKQFKVHRHTQALRLVYDADFRHYNPTHHPLILKFEEALQPLLSRIANFYGHNGFIIRLVFAKLKAGGKIYAHFDLQYSLMNCHRIHIPIISNEKSLFFVGGEQKIMKEGEIWEINNATVHEVDNRGDEDRVHLIVDWAPHATVRNQDRREAVVAQESAKSESNDYTDVKIGRNEPCPCGSGKKYKKCHGAMR